MVDINGGLINGDAAKLLNGDYINGGLINGDASLNGGFVNGVLLNGDALSRLMVDINGGLINGDTILLIIAKW